MDTDLRARMADGYYDDNDVADMLGIYPDQLRPNMPDDDLWHDTPIGSEAAA